MVEQASQQMVGRGVAYTPRKIGCVDVGPESREARNSNFALHFLCTFGCEYSLIYASDKHMLLTKPDTYVLSSNGVLQANYGLTL